ncbi:methyl-accepting chemotaxis protein [Rhizobium sp. PAMB 3182]
MTISDISVSKRFWLAVMIPATVALFLSVIIVRDMWRAQSNMDLIAEVSRDVAQIGRLIETLQVERGTTAGFIGSAGAKMGEPMRKARAATDVVAGNLASVAKKLAVADVSVPALIGEIETELARIGTIRSSIDGQALPGKDAFGFYTGLIGKMLQLNTDLTGLAFHSDVTFQLMAVNELMLASELAGQERGMGAGIISSGKFADGQFTAFSKFGGAQSVLMDRFLALQDADRRAEAGATFRQEAFTSFDGMRDNLIRRGSEADLSGLDPAAWFADASERISKMIALQEASLAEVGTIADGLSDDIHHKVILLLAAIAIAATLSILIPASLAVTVLRPLKALTQAMRDLLAGRGDIHSIPSLGRNEIGAMADSVRGIFVMVSEQSERERQEELRVAAMKADEEEAQNLERARIAQEQAAALEALSAALDHLANGDFEKRMSLDLSENFRPMARNFNDTVEMMRKTMSDIRTTSREINGSADALAFTSDELAARTEEQNRSLETSSNALRILTETVRSTADNAQRAMHAAQESKMQAERSGNVVRQAVAAMGAINSSSSQIGQIIGVIDDIAFQTNLLALNAGVEAARAGEAGKGFAVVAQEVRELAQRSAHAAKEIKHLISASSNQVKSGVSLVEETGTVLTAIIEQISETSGLVSIIASNTTEQSAQLTEVNHAISEIEQITTQNTQMVIDSSREIHDLTARVNHLHEKLARFRTRDEKHDSAYEGPERRKSAGLSMRYSAA